MVSDSSCVNFKHLLHGELEERLRNAQKNKREAIKLAACMAVAVKETVEHEGIAVNEDQHVVLQEVLKKTFQKHLRKVHNGCFGNSKWKQLLILTPMGFYLNLIT